MLRLASLSLLFSPGLAHATEVVWEGHYRARGQLFDSLSMSTENASAEGTSALVDHRLRLQPGWLLSSDVGLFTQLDLLPYVAWGDSPVTEIDIASGDELPVAYTQAVQPPETDEGGATLQNLRVTRLWGEVNTGIGRFRFGRLPIEWGTGMVFNAGNDPWDEAGDTADRVQLTSQVGPVHLFGSVGTAYEGFLGESDDLNTVTGGMYYQTETAGVGAYNTYRWQKSDDTDFSAYTGDLWFGAEAGPLTVEGEFAAVLGGGDLDTGANDIQLSAFGANLSVEVATDPLLFGLGGGLATGDSDLEDGDMHTFSFDRDFQVGLLLFEEAMPVLESSVMNESNGGRDTEAVRTGTSVENALYLRPHVGYQIREYLVVDLAVLAARAAVLPEDEEAGEGYGIELDASVRYDPVVHAWTQATVGVLLSGKYFTEYEHEDLGADFDRPVLGVQVLGTVEF